MNLLHINRNLAIVYVYILKDALKKLWDYKYPKAAAKYLAQRCNWAAVSGIEALRKFARSLLKAKDEILNFCKHRITIGPLEGSNNTISRIIHRACGLTNLDCLLLKLRQESLEIDQRK
jgi:transposase